MNFIILLAAYYAINLQMMRLDFNNKFLYMPIPQLAAGSLVRTHVDTAHPNLFH